MPTTGKSYFVGIPYFMDGEFACDVWKKEDGEFNELDTIAYGNTSQEAYDHACELRDKVTKDGTYDL